MTNDTIDLSDPAIIAATEFTTFVYGYPLFTTIVIVLLIIFKGPPAIYCTLSLLAFVLGMADILSVAVIRWPLDGPWRLASYIAVGTLSFATGGYAFYRSMRETKQFW